MVTVIFFFAIPFNIGSPFFKKKNSLFPGGSDGKGSHCNVEDPGIKPGSRRSPGKGHDYPLQYSCMENSMDRVAWLATVHGVVKSQTGLNNTFITFVNIYIN